MDRRVLLSVVLAVPLIVAACSASSVPTASGSPPPSPIGGTPTASDARGPTQTSEGGQVTVVATWAGAPAEASFDIQLDTHSVDLDALDLADATLRNDRGETLAVRPWAASKGGHHREGALTFDGDTSRFFAGTSWIELVLVDVGDLPERTLRWEIRP
jgi:hypothetical protein